MAKTAASRNAGTKVAARSGADGRPTGNGAHAKMQHFPAEELIEDFRLSCLSRALDDREIMLQKQSRVFFQISGAGHEILYTALARSLRPAYDWFFPYYRDRAMALALGVTPLAVMLQAVGSVDDPASGGRQMPCHF
ncbi:MAG TPA: thiamine pyrophosphate-dependent enzyme, partial [Acidimicrobiales bacterium]|nr:thiamine pyrophosphate-dependent enzyme [Acidimicrobiales bacterium]